MKLIVYQFINQFAARYYLQTFNDPSLTEYELAKEKAIIAKKKDTTTPAAAETILLMIETFKNAPHHEA